MVALGKCFFIIRGLQVALGVRYKEVKSEQDLRKAQCWQSNDATYSSQLNIQYLLDKDYMKEDKIRTGHRNAQPLCCYRLMKP